MEMDLTIDRYETWEDLRAYMDGSAAVIGEMMLPILEPVDEAAALGPARALGEAFQLTNFLRDVDEDLDRGRAVPPAGGPAPLRRRPRRAGRVTPGFVDLMRFEIERCRALYRSPPPGSTCCPTARPAAWRRPRPVRPHPRPHRGPGLRRVRRAGPGVDARKLAVAARHLAGRAQG